MNDKQIVDEIIHYLKLNNSGHIDRDNVFDVLVSYVESGKLEEIEELKDEITGFKQSIKSVIIDLDRLI